MQKSSCGLHSIFNMLSFRALLCHRTISFLRETRLLRAGRILSLSAVENVFDRGPIISCMHIHASHSDAQLPDEEEGDSAARAWSLLDPLHEQLVSSTAANEGLPREEKAPQKGTMGIIKRVDDAGPEDEGEKLFSRSRYSLPYRAWGRPGGSKARDKLKSVWVCKECGADHGQWWGSCPNCKTIGSVKRFVAETKFVKSQGRLLLKNESSKAVIVPRSLADVNKGINLSDWRIPLHGLLGMEIARVLGGGVVPGSLVLIGGDPGVGKSTLLLQIAANITQGYGSKGSARVLYVSGEESIEQVANRADRMRITTEDLYLYSCTDIEDILDKVLGLSPQALIMDSIQTVYLRDVTGSAGNISQVKECTLRLMQFAKETNIPVFLVKECTLRLMQFATETNIPVFLIGHVTKTGDIAGPRMLEHMVDVVLYMEGERYSLYRLLRSVKNRFGSTDELGLLEMTEFGLQAVSNPSEMFLSENYFDSDILAGLALAIVVDGSRTFVIEIQALCVHGSSVARHVNGIQESRADMIISVLMKQAGLKLHENAIFLNVVSGFKLTETAGDLAVAAAICSSFLEVPIPHDVAFVGEIGLGGELRMVPRVEKRLIAAAKLGFKRCIVPKAAETLLSSLDSGITALGCRTLKDVINLVFSSK